jgi:hypothetical protein
LRAEQVEVGHQAPQRGVDVETVVDHVRDAEFRAVTGLVGPLPAEPYVAGVHAGALVEMMALQPLQGPPLDALAALGDHPGAPAEPCDQSGQHVEHPGRRR